MNRRSALAAAAALAGLLSLGSVAALADNGATVTFRDASYDKVTIEVRVGSSADPSASIPFGDQTLTKGQSWDVDTGGLIVFWRREATPGSGDGTYTPWQKIVTSQSLTQNV
ncbi:MAG: hypothetical protein ABI346_01650 [Candidatus Baltobacteraceae bacterium]